jgi:hypothetical protein
VAEVCALTRSHRERLAARHEARAELAAARGLEAWDKIGRTETLDGGGCLGHVERTDKGERLTVQARRAGLWTIRVRRRWVPRRDGRPGRKLQVLRVAVPRHRAMATASKWHSDRALGQRARRATVEHCGEGSVTVTCQCCGSVAEGRVFCGVVRLCFGCTRQRAFRARARLARAVAVVVDNARARGAFLAHRTGGPLGQRHVVLTAPHVVVPLEGPGSKPARLETAAARVELLFRAWGHFSKRLARWIDNGGWKDPDLRARSGAAARGSCWHRAFEWTPGAADGDGCGHPHFHLWILSPFLPEYDEHRMPSVIDGRPSPSTRCLAQGEHAAKKRAKLCPLCAARVERRTGLRSWWVEALERAADKPVKRASLRGPEIDALSFRRLEGWRVEHATINVTVRKVWMRPIEFFREVVKSNGQKVTVSRMSRLQLLAAGGELIGYMEGWSIATLDRRSLEHAGADVLAGLYCALEGRRLSQSSRVTLRARSGRDCVVGLMGIADMLYDATCRDCAGYARAVGAPAPLPEARKIEVTSWATLAQADDERRWPTRPRGPPSAEPAPSDGPSWSELVASLQRAERAPLATAAASRLEAVCAELRREGPAMLPIYRRSGAPLARPRMTARDKMRAALRAERRERSPR